MYLKGGTETRTLQGKMCKLYRIKGKPTEARGTGCQSVIPFMTWEIRSVRCEVRNGKKEYESA